MTAAVALTTARPDRRPGPTAVACSGRLPEVLARIRDPHRGLAVWERRLQASVTSWVAGGFRPTSGRCAFTLDAPEACAETMEAALADCLVPGPGCVQWRRDVQSLITLVWRISPQTAPLRVRIDRVEDDGCRLFHVDRTALRLVCTYAGLGTQWLPEGAFDRAGLGCGCNDHVRNWSALREIGTGHVAVMKGERYPGHAGRGFVHRSPPASRAQPRVLLAIDFE